MGVVVEVLEVALEEAVLHMVFELISGLVSSVTPKH